MRACLILVALSTLLARPAASCPATEDNRPCGKYKFMYDRLGKQPVPLVTVYVRDRRGALPKGKAKLQRHLFGSGWHSHETSVTQGAIQLLDGADIPEMIDTEVKRAVIVHDVVRLHGRYHVTIDGEPYAIKRCEEAGKTRTCLVLVPPKTEVPATDLEP